MTKKKNNSFIALLFAATILAAGSALAWTGYDYTEKTEIIISGGNLVREGLVIEFYDTRADEYHNGKIIMMEETSGGDATLKVEDFNTEKTRVFVMSGD